MNRSISSDISDPKMLADQTFNNILYEIQRSNLNFQLQVSPFSAYISLKKSLVKDRCGSLLLPPLSSSNVNTDYAELIARINQLENDLLIQKNNHEDAVSQSNVANEKLEYCEAKSEKLEKEIKALKQDNKSLAAKLETKAFEVNQLKTKTDELNKEKNVLSIALKSAKHDLKVQNKASEEKFRTYEKKLNELNEFKAKKLQEERKERLQKKKERKKLAKQCSENNNNTNKDAFAVKEEDDHENDIEKGNNADHSVEDWKESTKENSVSLPVNKSQLSDAHPPTFVDQNPDVISPNLELSDKKLKTEPKEIELEEKEEGFIGPRLPRLMSDEEVKALLDRLLGDKWK